MKRAAIKQFDWLYLGAFAVTVIQTVLNYEALKLEMQSELAATGAQGASDIALIGGLVISLIVTLTLWFLISVKRVEVVKWLIAIFAAWGAISFLLSVSTGSFDAGSILGAIVAVMNIVAAYLLFTPNAKAWFERRDDGSVA